jgi:hypothetical protein
VILPLVPLAMLLSFVAGLTGMLVPSVAGWVGLPASGLLGLMIGVTQWFGTWPLAGVSFQSNGLITAAFYGLLAILLMIIRRSQSRRPLPMSRLAGIVRTDHSQS